MKKFNLKKWLTSANKGQSLVEMAITAPILIFMMIGVFEVGWALRGYLVLVNVNREITRFAVRPGYLNFSTKPDVITSYNRIYDWVKTANSGQIALDFSPTISGNSTLIVSHMVVDTGYPYDPDSNPSNWDCEKLDPKNAGYSGNKNNIFTLDDLIIHPGISTYAYQAMTFPATATRTIPSTLISYTKEVSENLIPANNKFNCEIIKRGGVASANNLIITEMFFNQRQLLGFPLISNPFTDPVPMYGHTIMRLSTGARSAGTEAGSLVANIDNIGPVCIAIPLTIHSSKLTTAVPGTIFDVLGGYPDPDTSTAGTNDRGFLAWDPQWNSETDLRNELLYPQTSFNAYENARDASDHTLSVGDWVASLPGNNGGAIGELRSLVGQDVIVPVWNGFTPAVPPSLPAAFKVVSFIKVRLFDDPPNSGYPIDLTSNAPRVWASYIGPATECMP